MVCNYFCRNIYINLDLLGVLDAYSYANVQPMDRLYLDVEDAEGALKGWVTYCVDAPDSCSLGSLGNGTASGVMSVINNILDTAYRTYDGSSPPSATGYTFNQISNEIYLSLSNSGMWKNLDNYLVSLNILQANSTSIPSTSDRKRTKIQPQVPLLSPEIRYAINCGDVVDPEDYNTIELFRMLIDVASFTSPHFGSLVNYRWICHRYTTRSAERFSSLSASIRDVKTKPKNVVLVIGNSADPIAPYNSAKSIASGAHLGSMARLIRLNAVGHTSSASLSPSKVTYDTN